MNDCSHYHKKLFLIFNIIAFFYFFLYGALCWYFAKWVGILLGLNIIMLAWIVGILSMGDKDDTL